jgi:hypothetical protein
MLVPGLSPAVAKSFIAELRAANQANFVEGNNLYRVRVNYRDSRKLAPHGYLHGHPGSLGQGDGNCVGA